MDNKNFIPKSDLIDLLYSQNGKNFVDVDVVYDFKDSDFRLKIALTPSAWNIDVIDVKERSNIARVSFEKHKTKHHGCKTFKITKQEAKDLASLVYCIWNASR